MSNRTDFDNQAREFLEWMRSQPADEIQARLERELNDAFVAGQEDNPVTKADLRQLVEDMDEALAAIEKTPGIDVAIKTLRYVRDVLEARGAEPAKR